MAIRYHILSTAELPAAALSGLNAAGCHTAVQPFIHTEVAVSEAMKQRILQLARLKTTAVFTSAHAVAAVRACLPDTPDWTIFALSGTTLRAATDFFGADRIAGHAVSGQLLAEQVMAASIPELVFFCGDKRLDTLPSLLKEASVRVEEFIVYTTTATPVLLTDHYDGVLFFSPSAVESFFSQNSLADQTTLFAIGNTTAAALHAYGANNIITAAFPSKESVAESVIRHFK